MSFYQNKTTEDSMLSEKKKVKWLKLLIKIFGFLVIFYIVNFFIFSNSALISDDSWFYKMPIINSIKYLAESNDKQLTGENDDRINILLLGMGGSKHAGGNLTDAMMLISLKPSINKIAIISIPRDLVVPIDGKGWRKINSINAFAEMKEKNSGGLVTSQSLSNILDIPIDYFVRIDFDGFVNIVDKLGGIEVYADNTLKDCADPIWGEELLRKSYAMRAKCLNVPQGWQEMDGLLALKYARSRHAFGIEGSDFARARRQQRIVEALKNKALSENILFRPKLIVDIINEFQNNISTNLKIWEIIKLWNIYKKIPSENVVNKVIDNGPDGLLVSGKGEDEAYILTPRSNDFTEIQDLALNIFSDVQSRGKTEIITEKASVEIRNGTLINGLASKTAENLKLYGFNIINVNNYKEQNFQKSIIYDLTYGVKNKALDVLKRKTNADVSLGLPQWLIDEIEVDLVGQEKPTQPDFILILGQE